MDIVIALFENMTARLAQDLPELNCIVFNQLSKADWSNQPKAFQHTLLQAVSMAFAYDAPAVFKWLEAGDFALAVFQQWFA